MIEFTHREMRTAKTVSRRAAARYGLDADELLGVLHLWLVESYKYVTGWRDQQGGGAKLAASLFRHANKWAREEHEAKVIVPKAQQDLDESQYTVKQVEVALVLMFLNTDTTSEYDEETWACVADISGVFVSLIKAEKELLHQRFGLHEQWAAIGERLGVDADAARMRVQRLLQKMVARASSDKSRREQPWVNNQGMKG